MTAVHDAILATLNGMVRVFTRTAPGLPGKSALAAAANLVTLIASLPDDSGAPPAAPPHPSGSCRRASGRALVDQSAV